jgi:hypothetical protein
MDGVTLTYRTAVFEASLQLFRRWEVVAADESGNSGFSGKGECICQMVVDPVGGFLTCRPFQLDVIEQATQTAVAEMEKMDRTTDEIVMTISSTLNSKQYGSHPRNRDQSVLSPDPSLLLRLISDNND